MNKSRLLWTFVVVALGVALGTWYVRKGTSSAPTVRKAHTEPVEITGVKAVAAPQETATSAAAVSIPVVRPASNAAKAPVLLRKEPLAGLAPGQTVAIEEGKTIDFSSGSPVVKKSDAADQAALEAGLKEIEEATKGMTLGTAGGK